jgi:membrane protein DedA with SNARE-associated domain
MALSEYIMFVLVAILGAGLPGPGDAALIAAGTLAGEGRLNVWLVLALAMAAWMLGSVAGYEIGVRGGRGMLGHPGRLEKSRRKLLAKGDRAFARWNFLASVTMPAFVSGIFRVRFRVFVLGAVTAGIGWIGMYVGVSYFLGAEIAKRIGNAGAKAVLGVVVIVAAGLAIRAVVAKWRATRQTRAEAALRSAHWTPDRTGRRRSWPAASRACRTPARGGHASAGAHRTQDKAGSSRLGAAAASSRSPLRPLPRPNQGPGQAEHPVVIRRDAPDSKEAWARSGAWPPRAQTGKARYLSALQ